MPYFWLLGSPVLPKRLGKHQPYRPCCVAFRCCKEKVKNAVKGESGASFRLVNVARPCSGPVVPAVLGILPPPVRCSEPQRLAQLDWQCPGVCSIRCRKLKMTAASSWQSQHPTRGCVACALPPKGVRRVSSCRPLTVVRFAPPTQRTSRGREASLPPGHVKRREVGLGGALTWRR